MVFAAPQCHAIILHKYCDLHPFFAYTCGCLLLSVTAIWFKIYIHCTFSWYFYNNISILWYCWQGPFFNNYGYCLQYYITFDGTLTIKLCNSSYVTATCFQLAPIVTTDGLHLCVGILNVLL